MRISKSAISIVIPVFNAKDSLRMLTQEIIDTMREEERSFELILVNDGSSDNSWLIIEDLAKQNKSIVGICLMRNYGQHNALLCGIRAAKYDTVVTMDDDLQHPPETIQVLLDKLEEGYDVVYGSPLIEKHGLFRDFASLATKFVLKSVMKVDTAQYVSAYRAFRTNLRDSFINYLGSTVSIDVLLSWGTSRFGYVKIQHRDRRFGVSHYTFRKLIQHAMNLITGYTTILLRISSVTGFVFTIFGIIILLYVLIHYLVMGGVVPGFTFLASVIAIFSGAQLFALGIMGEYLARMHFRLMDKPSYIVYSKAEHDEK